MKIFISQPMRGKSTSFIKNERGAIVSKLKEIYGEDIEIIDSVLTISGGHPLVYLGESIKLLSQADVVVFMDGWRKARGCRSEHTIAIEYDLKIVYAENFTLERRDSYPYPELL